MMFEKASRLKLRFDSPQGLLSVEQLWDLPLTSKTAKANLDDIARALHKQLKSGDDVSFVDNALKSDEGIQFKFDLVKHMIDVRLAEREAAQKAQQKAEKKQKLLSLIADKEDQAMAGLSVEDLRKMLTEL